MKKKQKLVFLQNIIYPIRDPFYRKLHKSGKFDMKVLFLSDTASNRKWLVSKETLEYPSRVLKGIRFRIDDQDKFDHSFNPLAIIDFIVEWPDIVVTWGWANLTNLIFMLLCMLFRKPYYVWCENTLNEPSKKRDAVKPIVKFFVKHSRACFVPGKNSYKYVKSLNKNIKTVIIPNAIDNSEWSQGKSMKTHKNKVVVLFVGRLEEIKGIRLLLDSVRLLSKKKEGKFVLQLVGYGSMEDYIKRYTKKYNLSKYIDLVGYVPREQTVNYYNSADLFVLPSMREPWGMVVNEAMASGLPILVSDKVGCGPDLVQEGENGYVHKSSDLHDLTNKLGSMITNNRLRRKMGKESERIASNYNYDRMAAVFMRNTNI